MTTRDDIVTEAKTWIGTKFKKGGRDRTGVDCIGLLVVVGRKFSFNIFDTVEYSFNPEPEKFQELVYDQTVPRKLNDLDVGSIALFRQSLWPMHTGIISKDQYGRYTVINSSLKERKVVEEPYEQWLPLLIDLRDYKEIT